MGERRSADLLNATMPSDQSTWLISVPLDGDSEGLLQEIAPKLTQQAKLPIQDLAHLSIPSFKVGTGPALTRDLSAHPGAYRLELWIL